MNVKLYPIIFCLPVLFLLRQNSLPVLSIISLPGNLPRTIYTMMDEVVLLKEFILAFDKGCNWYLLFAFCTRAIVSKLCRPLVFNDLSKYLKIDRRTIYNHGLNEILCVKKLNCYISYYFLYPLYLGGC